MVVGRLKVSAAASAFLIVASLRDPLPKVPVCLSNLRPISFFGSVTARADDGPRLSAEEEEEVEEEDRTTAAEGGGGGGGG